MTHMYGSTEYCIHNPNRRPTVGSAGEGCQPCIMPPYTN